MLQAQGDQSSPLSTTRQLVRASTCAPQTGCKFAPTSTALLAERTSSTLLAGHEEVGAACTSPPDMVPQARARAAGWAARLRGQVSSLHTIGYLRSFCESGESAFRVDVPWSQCRAVSLYMGWRAQICLCRPGLGRRAVGGDAVGPGCRPAAVPGVLRVWRAVRAGHRPLLRRWRRRGDRPQGHARYVRRRAKLLLLQLHVLGQCLHWTWGYRSSHSAVSTVSAFLLAGCGQHIVAL